MTYRKHFILAVTAAMAVLILANDAMAVPAFARKYRTSCMTCHAAFPRRNAVGESFRLNGFRFEDDETYCKEAPVEMGDEAYKRLWPKAVWPSDIPLYVPLSFSSRFLMETDMDGTRKNPLTFLLPEEIELVWAGTLGPDISFYGDIIHLQKDFGGQPVSAWTTIKGWLEFQNLMGEDGRLNLRLGTVGVHTMGLYTALDSNNFTTHFYQYTTWMMPDVDIDKAGIAEFEGNPFSIQPQMGFELNGHSNRWLYAAGIVAGNLMAPGNEEPDAPIAFNGTARNVDNKDVYGQLAFKIGGSPFTSEEADQTDAEGTKVDPLAVKSDYWRDDSLTLSAWGYLGTAQIVTMEIGADEEDKWKERSQFWRAGLGFLKKYKDIDIGAGYVLGRDETPYGNLTPEAVKSKTWFAEILGFVYPWFMPYLRYEGMTLDLPQGVPGVMDAWDMQRVLPGFKAMLRSDVSVTVELPLYFEGSHLEEGFDRSLFMLLSVAF